MRRFIITLLIALTLFAPLLAAGPQSASAYSPDCNPFANAPTDNGSRITASMSFNCFGNHEGVNQAQVCLYKSGVAWICNTGYYNKSAFNTLSTSASRQVPCVRYVTYQTFAWIYTSLGNSESSWSGTRQLCA